MRALSGFLILIVLQVYGCVSIGPDTVARDRFDYVSAISESWKRQTLLNLVKTRYVDAPVFMDVSSVINQYAVEGQIQLGASWADSPLTDTQNVLGTGKYTDRPTVTYSPLMGERFTRSLMTPIPIDGILFLIQTGYPADYVYRICVQTVNGISNRFGARMMGRDADPEFYELMALLRHIQTMGGLGMRVHTIDEKESVVMFFRPLTDESIAAEMRRVREILGLAPDVREFRVAYGAFSEDNTEIAILSRSMMQVLIEYASYIDVPASDVSEGRVGASKKDSAENAARFPPLVQVKNGKSKPHDAYVSVPYRDQWFWIDDRDLHSKTTFYFLMVLFSLTERGGGQGAPIVTVPVN